MSRGFRSAALGVMAMASLSLVACYAHYAWIAVEASQTSTTISEARAATLSEAEIAEAVAIAGQIARSHGLEVSRMDRLPPPEPTPEDPFRRLALFRGSGEYENLQLSVAIRDDRSVIRCWISDLDHARETGFTSALVKTLKEQFERAFPTRAISVGDGRKLRIYAG
jgi:hypothetical protein